MKPHKKLREILKIYEYHYQLYSILILFKHINLETISDILNNDYMKLLIDNKNNNKYEIITKLIEKKKLYLNKIFELDINDPLTEYIIKNKKITNYLINIQSSLFKINYNLKEIIIEPKNNIKDKDYINELDIIKNNIEKIIFNLNIDSKKLIKTRIIKSKFLENIIHLSINLNLNEKEPLIDLSFFNNLESLSITSVNEIKLYLSKNQYNKIKILKLFYDFHDENKFENLEELYTYFYNIGRINFKSTTLKKIHLIITYLDYFFQYDDLSMKINSVTNILLSYISLTDINLEYKIKGHYSTSIDILKSFKLNDNFINLYNSIDNLKYYNLTGKIFYYDATLKKDTTFSFNYYFEYIEDKKLFFEINDNNINYQNYPNIILGEYLFNIEEITLKNSQDKLKLSIEENNLSNITKIRIDGGNSEIIYIPIKSYASLIVLDLKIKDINFVKAFPLFEKNSNFMFPNLEHIELHTYKIQIIENLIENISNAPKLRFLSVVNNNMLFDYQKKIISKCFLLNKLHTLIVGVFTDNNFDNFKLYNINEKYYNIYPELKKTSIKFGYFSK